MDKLNDTKEHILACISASPSNSKIIKTAAQMAEALDGDFTALYVKTPYADKGKKENRERLEKHIRLAQELGAEIVTIYGEDISAQIIEFAKISKATKIVLGYNSAIKHSLFSKQTLTDKLIHLNPGMDIHIVLDAEINKKYNIQKFYTGTVRPDLSSLAITIGILVASTVLNFLFRSLKFTDANMITVYILGALLTALFTKNYICSGIYSIVSVLLFNFFFTEPRLSLVAYESGYPVTFAIMLIASLLTGTLANRLAYNAKLYANTAYRTNIMLETNQLMQKADGETKIIEIMATQIAKLLGRNVVVYPVRASKLESGRIFPINKDSECKALLTPQEQTVAKWVFENHKRAGASTGRMNNSLGMYLAVRTSEEVFCVIGIQIGAKNIEPFENSIVISILGEGALAIENIRNATEKEQNALLAKNEQLKANLLRSISHDLRTPLTSISGNTENLLTNFEQIDEETRKQLLTDVYNDSQWLINLVENLLSITRISEGRMSMNMSAQLVDEVVNEALWHINRKRTTHRIRTIFHNDLLLADMDARLIVQVLINLIDNAIKYTPEGTEIEIQAEHTGTKIRISVADQGFGIEDSKKEDVFKMFYTGENRVADCRRSLGLGLALCKSIVTAHGGEIIVTDNHPKGAVFTFTLKASEVHLNE